MRSTQASLRPSRRAAASDCGVNSASSECSGAAAGARYPASRRSGRRFTPRFSCTSSRPLSEAKLAHRPRTRPASSASTPTKSSGAFTSEATSMLLSRNCTERDSGSCSGSTSAMLVMRDFSSPLPSSPTTLTVSPALSGEGSSRAALHRRAADQLRIVMNHRQVVQRVHVDDLAGNLDGAGKGQPHVAHRHRHGVAVGDDQAALGVDDQPGAVIVALGDARDRIRHVEGNADQRRTRSPRRSGHRRGNCAEAGAGRFGAAQAPAGRCTASSRCASSRWHWRAGNQRRSMRRAQLAGVGIIDGDVAHGHARAVAQLADARR
jgi:hypothetical protein